MKDYVQEKIFELTDGNVKEIYFNKNTKFMDKLENTSLVFGVGFKVETRKSFYKVSMLGGN